MNDFDRVFLLFYIGVIALVLVWAIDEAAARVIAALKPTDVAKQDTGSEEKGAEGKR